MTNTTKKYKYEEIETGRTIYANSGDEADRLWKETYGDSAWGKIRLTNLETGYENMMYPITIH